jgi:hypothetical protein
MRGRLYTLGLVMLLAGCATPEPPPPPPPPPPKVEKPKMESQPLKHLKGRNVQELINAIHTRPLNVKTRCSFRDEVTGTRGHLDLQVKEDEVKRFVAQVNVPKRGICRFDIKDFGQTGARQPVTLTGKGNSCAVRMWEQGTKVTVAFNECTAKCDGNAFEYLWPILIDGKTGRCV